MKISQIQSQYSSKTSFNFKCNTSWSDVLLKRAVQNAKTYTGQLPTDIRTGIVEELVPPVLRKNLSEAELKILSNYHVYKIDGTKNSYRGPRKYYDIEILKPFNLELIPSDIVVHNIISSKNPDSLVEFIKAMQQDSIFLGCPFGMNQTNLALLINQYFNPLSKDKTKYPSNINFNLFENLCNELKPNQKNEMQWTEEFEKNLRENIRKNLKILG